MLFVFFTDENIRDICETARYRATFEFLASKRSEADAVEYFTQHIKAIIAEMSLKF